jgi:hypothetical protein
MVFAGDVERNVAVSRIFAPQLDLALEGGFRLNPHLGLGLYLDLGYGDAGSEVKNFCNAPYPQGLGGASCSAETVKFGVLLRHTFQPAAHTTPWIAVGTGYAYGRAYSYGPSQDVITYTGWEIGRLMGGIDVRSSQVLGVGFYAGLSFTRYSHVDDATGSLSLPSPTIHTMFQAGLRLTLFP